MNATTTNTYARLAWHGHNHLTIDTTSGYVEMAADTLAASAVKTGALKIGDLVEHPHMTRQDENGKTYRRVYRRVASIISVNGGARIGFVNEDGTEEVDDLFPLTKYGWGKSWWLVTEEVAA